MLALSKGEEVLEMKSILDSEGEADALLVSLTEVVEVEVLEVFSTAVLLAEEGVVDERQETLVDWEVEVASAEQVVFHLLASLVYCEVEVNLCVNPVCSQFLLQQLLVKWDLLIAVVEI